MSIRNGWIMQIWSICIRAMRMVLLSDIIKLRCSRIRTAVRVYCIMIRRNLKMQRELHLVSTEMASTKISRMILPLKLLWKCSIRRTNWNSTKEHKDVLQIVIWNWIMHRLLCQQHFIRWALRMDMTQNQLTCLVLTGRQWSRRKIQDIRLRDTTTIYISSVLWIC